MVRRTTSCVVVTLLAVSAWFIAGCGDYEKVTSSDASDQGDPRITQEATTTVNSLDGSLTTSGEAVGVRSRVVSPAEDTPVLDPGIMVISHRLGVNFEVPGVLFGTKAKKPLQLGPPGSKMAMTKDGLGGEGLPVAVPSPDGTQVLYHFWQWLISDDPQKSRGEPTIPPGSHMATPSIRVLDLVSGEDRQFVSGAHSVAWREDGVLAYALGVDADYRFDMPYLSRVVVREGLDGPAETWTTDAGSYLVLQWANGSLIVSHEFIDGGGELLAIDGPDQIRRLIAPEEYFIALSPDGTRMLVSAGGPDSGEPLTVREIEWQTGREIARLSLEGVLDPATGEPLTFAYGASWEGDRVAVSVPPADLAILSAKDDTLQLEEILTFERRPGIRQGRIVQFLLDETGSRVSFAMREGTDTVELEQTVIVTYDLASGECRRWVSPGGPAVAEMVYNPSRPR